VLIKGKEGCNGVRLTVDYRYVNRFTRDDAYPLPIFMLMLLLFCSQLHPFADAAKHLRVFFLQPFVGGV